MNKHRNYYDKKYFSERDHIDSHIAEAIKILLAKNNFRSVLDVGCGSGRLVKNLLESGYSAQGCDVNPEALKSSRKLVGKQRITRASATKLPFLSKSFDFVTSVSVIEHLTGDQGKQFLKETRRVLKREGMVFLVTPNLATPVRWVQGKDWFGYSDPTHVQFYSPLSLGGLLRICGYTNIQYLFRTKYDADFYWDLPAFLQQVPLPVKTVITYVLTATPLFILRNSFWIAARA